VKGGRYHHRRVFFALLAASVSACSLVTAGLDLDSSAGVGGSAPPGVDAGDAGDAHDSSPDVYTAISAFRCADAHSLCDSFDEGDLGSSPWTRITRRAPTATIELVNDRFASPPRALLATIPESLLDVSEQNAHLERVFAEGFTSINCSLKVLLDATRTTGHVSPIEIYLGAPSESGLAETEVSFSITAGVPSLFYRQFVTSEIGIKEDYPLDGSFPVRTWVGITLRVDRNEENRIVAALLMNGNDVATAYASFRTGSTPAVRIGVVRGAPAAAPLSMLIDDVFCDVK